MSKTTCLSALHGYLAEHPQAKLRFVEDGLQRRDVAGLIRAAGGNPPARYVRLLADTLPLEGLAALLSTWIPVPVTEEDLVSLWEVASGANAPSRGMNANP